MDERIEPIPGSSPDRAWGQARPQGDLLTPPPASPAQPDDPDDEPDYEPDYEEVLSAAGTLLDDVDRALGRLDEGTYDSCEVCGAAIGEDRLTGDPTARTCALHPR
ncbi:MAG TPA: hypothetical protein VMU76_08790 [Acidimicrobiales bacterium]|nr:hypothetical protein [Acidimicrobiales bacterium]